MFLTLIAIVLITLNGTILTYLFNEKDSLLVRVCAGNVIGSIVWGIVGFIVASLFGFSTSTVLFALFISLAPLALLIKRDFREKLLRDWRQAQGNLKGANFNKFLSFAYYAGWLVFAYFFFKQAIVERAEGIFTNAPLNGGDLSFHLGAITSFVSGNNFPPENPSFAFTKFTYPFIVDLIASYFVQFSASFSFAFLVQNVFLGFALVVLLENFTVRLTQNRLAGKLAPLIFLFSGGLGFIIFFPEFFADGRHLIEYLWHLPNNYTIRTTIFRWGNPLMSLFINQRSLLLGMPLVLIALTKLWEFFITEKHRESKSRITNYSLLSLGLVVGTLPLVHLHSLIVVFIVSAFWFAFSWQKWRDWLVFGVSTAIVAVPAIIWATTGSATRPGEFVGWHFGWDSGGANFIVFWLKNLGVFFPILFVAIGWLFYTAKDVEKAAELDENNRALPSYFTASQIIAFYAPFLFCLVISNIVKLAPWEWDNIKILIYWFLGSVPFVAWLLAKIWEKGLIFKLVTAVCFILLTFSGSLDALRTISGTVNFKGYNADAVEIAEQIKQKTPPNAVFLNAPTFNSAVVLSGRRSMMRYWRHLFSHGIEYKERLGDLNKIYAGDETAPILLKKYAVDYVIIGDEENAIGNEETELKELNREFFQRFPVVAEAGNYKVYQVKK